MASVYLANKSYISASGRAVECDTHRNSLRLREVRVQSGRLQDIDNTSKRLLVDTSSYPPEVNVPSTKACHVFDMHEQLVPYAEAREWQQRLVAERLAGGETDSAGTVLLLQHEPVFTMGAGSSTEHLNFDPDKPPLPLHRTERGGEVTYHGPGQLVMYPIVDLQRFTPDLHWYLRSLEEVVIRALKSVSGLEGERVEGLTGVWVGGSKVAAIGIRARRWVTYHGLALNVTTDMGPYEHIVPCGISDRPVASIAELLGEEHEDLMLGYSQGLLDSFSEVFGVSMQRRTRTV